MILLEKMILLRGVNLFKGISNELLTDIAYFAEEERWMTDQVIMREGDLGDFLYIIVDGKVSIQKGELKLEELGSGKTVGELAVLSPAPRSATVVALEECLLLKLKREDLFTHFGFDVEFSMGIIKELCERIRDLSNQVANSLKTSQVQKELARILVHFFEW